MKPITAPLVTNNGIVIYVPTKESFKSSKVEIFYSAKNPLFNYSHCEPSPSKIWEKKDTSFDKGSLFIYVTEGFLKKGFYRINLTVYNLEQTKFAEGSQTYAIINDKATLHIGLPYSTFGPILTT